MFYGNTQSVVPGREALLLLANAEALQVLGQSPLEMHPETLCIHPLHCYPAPCGKSPSEAVVGLTYTREYWVGAG